MCHTRPNTPTTKKHSQQCFFKHLSYSTVPTQRELLLSACYTHFGNNEFSHLPLRFQTRRIADLVQGRGSLKQGRELTQSFLRQKGAAVTCGEEAEPQKSQAEQRKTRLKPRSTGPILTVPVCQSGPDQ